MAGEITLASVSLDVALSLAGDGAVEKMQQEVAALVAIIEARNIAGRVARISHQIHGAIGFTADTICTSAPGACGPGGTRTATRPIGTAAFTPRPGTGRDIWTYLG